MKHFIFLSFLRAVGGTLLLLMISALALTLQVCSSSHVWAMDLKKDSLERREEGASGKAPVAAAAVDDRREEDDSRGKTSVTLNLVWVCDKPTSQKYIYAAKNEDELKSNFLDKAANWAKLHPSDDVNIWYDSRMLSVTAAADTQSILVQCYKATPNIKLRDLRSLSSVQAYPSAFHPNLSIYFRVDLYRLVAASELLSERGNDIFIYADLDMEPVDYNKIIEFHKEVLEEYGILMAKGKYAHEDGYLPYFENGFQIIKRDPFLLKILEEALIRPSIAKGQWVASLWGNTESSIYPPKIINDWELLIKQHKRSLELVKKALCSSLEELVYNAYWQAFFRWHEEKGHVKLIIKDESKVLDVGKKLFTVTREHVHFFPDFEYAVSGLFPKFMHLFIKRDPQESCLYVPIVEVPIPPSRFLKKSKS